MAHLARQAMVQLAYEYEIFTELVLLTQLAPFTIQPILDSVQLTGRVLAIEEGSLSLGWGAEIIARLASALGPRLLASQRLAARESPIPASGPLEAETLPDTAAIIQAVKRMV
jgi:2-oxoisovalerate dehydrogenase E1 component